MTDLKSALKALSIVALAAATLLSVSCSSAAVNYKPSTLPSLIIFSSDRDDSVQIYSVKPDSTDNRSVSNNSMGLDGLPTWSPDGTRIAFTSNQANDFDIWIMNEDGSNRVRLTEMIGWDGVPRWSPDGSRIVFAGERRSSTEGHTSFEIFIMNSDGSNVKKLTDSESLGHGAEGNEENIVWNSCPTFSPDGTKILFASNRDENAKPVLYIMNTDGSDQKKFGSTEIEGTNPDWSPVTGKIVFLKGTAAKGEIWVMDGNSPFPQLTAQKILANIDNNSNPVWSPDGKQIAFVSDTYGNDDIFVMNADGTNIRRITYEKSNERHPSWR